MSVAPNTVSEESLFPHLRAKIRSMFNSIITITNTITGFTDTIELAEGIDIGNAAAIGADGKAYKSSLLKSNSKPAQIIIAESGTTGMIVKYQTTGKLTIPGATFTKGAYVWLVVGTLNISTTPPAVASGNYMQRVGIAKAADTISINIEKDEFIL